MSDEIIKILDELGKKFGMAIDWGSENIMPYLQDLLKRFIAYRNIGAIVQIIIATVILIVGIILIVKLIKWGRSENFNKNYLDDDELLLALGTLGTVLLIALGIGLIIGNILGLLQNVYMPELTIINYIQRFKP